MDEEIKILPLAEQLEKEKIKFVGLSVSRESPQKIRVYVENEEQAQEVKNYLFAQGYKEVEIKIIGKIEPLLIEKTLALEPFKITKFQPTKEKEIIGGISVGGYETKFTGTLSVISKKDIGITAWHVIPQDKNIIHPGTIDGGDISDKIGNFKEHFIDKNIDLATFELLPEVPRKQNYVKVIGEVAGYVEPSNVLIGQEVEKYGRTSKYSKGKIYDKDVIVRVQYHDKVRLVPNCYIIEPSIGLPGDSGSLVTRIDAYAIGLLIAGNNLVTVVQHSEELKNLLS